MKALAASGKMKGDSKQASCTEVVEVAVKLTTVVLDFPGSPEILVFSATIISFPSTVVCTDDEKAALVEVDEVFDEAVALIELAVEAAQEQLETLTGSTASPEEIAELTTVEVTVDTEAPTTVSGASGADTTAPGSPPANTTAPGVPPANATAPAPGANTTAPGATGAPTTAPSSGANTTAPAPAGLYVFSLNCTTSLFDLIFAYNEE